MAGRMTQVQLPPWHDKNVDGKVTLNKTPLYNDISGKLSGLVERVRLDTLWVGLQKYKVVNGAAVGAIKMKRTQEERVQNLVERLQRLPSRNFHGFLKALSEDKQSNVIGYLGLDPMVYAEKLVGNMAGFHGAASRSANPIWSEHSMEGQTRLGDTDLYRTKVTQNYDKFVQDIRLDNLWPKFKRLNVLNKANQDRVRAERTPLDQVYRLMEVLETSHSWRFHAFLKALCEDDQEACLTLLGLNPAAYE